MASPVSGPFCVGVLWRGFLISDVVMETPGELSTCKCKTSGSLGSILRGKTQTEPIPRLCVFERDGSTFLRRRYFFRESGRELPDRQRDARLRYDARGSRMRLFAVRDADSLSKRGVTKRCRGPASTCVAT